MRRRAGVPVCRLLVEVYCLDHTLAARCCEAAQHKAGSIVRTLESSEFAQEPLENVRLLSRQSSEFEQELVQDLDLRFALNSNTPERQQTPQAQEHARKHVAPSKNKATKQHEFLQAGNIETSLVY